jgi:hypothetical protein
MQILEFKDVQDFSMREVRQGDALNLHMSGLAFHSSLAVDRIEQVTEGDTRRVRVVLCLASKAKSGRFNFDVAVPKGVRRVLFGNEGHEVWVRNAPTR